MLVCLVFEPPLLSQDHEIHRQWVALVDDENPRDSGTQGYLQLSIAIVGPGDKLKVKDEARARGWRGAGGGGTVVLISTWSLGGILCTFASVRVLMAPDGRGKTSSHTSVGG